MLLLHVKTEASSVLLVEHRRLELKIEKKRHTCGGDDCTFLEDDLLSIDLYEFKQENEAEHSQK